MEEEFYAAIKLTSGEEIVAKIYEETVDSYIVNKPCTVIPSQQGLGLVQSIFTSELNNNVPVGKSHVMMHSATAEQVKSHYITTTTGIETAPAEKIIT